MDHSQSKTEIIESLSIYIPFIQLYTKPYLTFLEQLVSVLSISQSLCKVLTKTPPALRAFKKNLLYLLGACFPIKLIDIFLSFFPLCDDMSLV